MPISQRHKHLQHPVVDIPLHPHRNIMKYDLSEITEIIRNRRTIYPEQFTDRVVQRDMVQHMLTNATWAPTHGKTQPWRFSVYSGDGRAALLATIEQLYLSANGEAAAADPKLKRIKERIQRTSVVIAMAMTPSTDPPIPEIEEIEAVACAAQNIMLTATAYGLGAFWSSPKFLYLPHAAQAFGYSPGDKLLGLMYLGYPAGEWPRSHRKPLEYVTRWIDQ